MAGEGAAVEFDCAEPSGGERRLAMRRIERALGWLLAVSLAAVAMSEHVYADELISENLPADRYSASSVYDYHVPSLAFDGGGLVFESTWVATDHVGWIEVDLGEVRDLVRIRLVLHMWPAGQATYRIWFSDEPMQGEFSSAVLVESYPGNHFDGQVMEKVLSQSAPARYVAVETSDSAAWAAWYEVQVFAADAPALRVVGTCPGGGPIEVSWTDATPSGQCALIFALDEGEFLIPARYPCQGTRLGLGSNQIQLVGTFRSDAEGARTVRGFAGNGACGAFLQLLDLTNCDTSNVAQIQ